MRFLFVISIFSTMLLSANNGWIVPQRPAVTIFFQGIFASQAQCAKYTGKRPLVGTTGQKIVCPKALDLILLPHIGRELDEVVLHDQTKRSVGYFILSPRNTVQKIMTYAQERVWSTIDTRDYDFHISTSKNRLDLKFHSIDTTQMNFGQEGDIEQHRKKHQLCQQLHQNVDIILYGVSRGAATTFNAHAMHHYQNVKLVVLEGCYYSLEDIIQTSYPAAAHQLIFSLLETTTDYKVHGVSPYTSLERFPEDVPVVFINSRADKRVPYACGNKLAVALANRGKNPVYQITLNHATHSRYHKDDVQDAERYLHCMHAIYKKYGLPHIPEYAALGEKQLESSRLTAAHLTQ